MAKRKVEKDKTICPGIVQNLLRESGLPFFEITHPTNWLGADIIADNGKRNTFFPGPKLLFTWNDDRPWKLKRDESGVWSFRRHRGAWNKLVGSNYNVMLSNMIETLFQQHIMSAVMEQ